MGNIIGLFIIIAVSVAMIFIRKRISEKGGPAANTLLRVGDAVSTLRLVGAALLIGMFLYVAGHR